MNKAIVTICCGQFFERLAAITHPTIEAYARRLGADFIVWREFGAHTMPHYQKLELGKLLDQYDRVLYLDTDVLVRDDAPDLFERVPENTLGMLAESDYVDRKTDVIQYMIAMGYDARQWDGKYYNAGVIVLSRQHKDLFVQPATETSHFKEQTHLNLMIARTGTKAFSLPRRFNRMYYMDWFDGEDRRDGYLIHYAGLNRFTSEADILQMAANDRATWESTRPDYHFPKHLAFVVQGGISDQAAAEPSIRYAREVLHPNDRLVIVALDALLYRHLGLPIYPSLENVPEVNRYLPCYTMSNPTRPPLAIDARRVHPVNLASLNMLGIELPIARRRFETTVDAAAVQTLRQKIAPQVPDELVVVHPGGVGENTIALESTWQAVVDAVVDAVVERGVRVAVIGSRHEPEHRLVELDTSGCLDLVDRLSPSETVALLSESRVLLAGDSAAVQVAGAFDGWIGLIGAARHADYVLPWRNGTQSWHTRAWEELPEAPVVVEFVQDAIDQPGN